MLSYLDISERLKHNLLSSNDVVLLSAYVKQSAIEWVNELVPDDGLVTLVSRFTCADIQAGSSDLEAIRLALDANWSVNSVPNLHAKSFMFDRETVMVGSANLTSNGLMLFGSGNLEAVIEKAASKEDIAFVESVVNSSHVINYEVLGKMEDYLGSSMDSKGLSSLDKWPDDLFPKERRIWVNDFLWLLRKQESSDVEMRKVFSNSNAYRWLIQILKSKSQFGLRYGELTKILHEDLCDDPSPYRTNVKELLSGLIRSVELYAEDEVDVSRFRYSQVLKLK